jgi:hypothetical protein
MVNNRLELVQRLLRRHNLFVRSRITRVTSSTNQNYPPHRKIGHSSSIKEEDKLLLSMWSTGDVGAIDLRKFWMALKEQNWLLVVLSLASWDVRIILLTCLPWCRCLTSVTWFCFSLLRSAVLLAVTSTRGESGKKNPLSKKKYTGGRNYIYEPFIHYSA